MLALLLALTVATATPNPTVSPTPTATATATSCEAAASEAGFDDPAGYCADPEPSDFPETKMDEAVAAPDSPAASPVVAVATPAELAPAVDDPITTSGLWLAEEN